MDALMDSSPWERVMLFVAPGEHSDFLIEQHKSGASNAFVELNRAVNELILGEHVYDATSAYVGEMPAHYLLSYARNVIMGSLLYYFVSGLWHMWIYNFFGTLLFDLPQKTRPSMETIRGQIATAQAALFIYAMLPVFSEFWVENDYTLAYAFVGEVGWARYAAFLVAYMVLVEMGIYWMHRKLHENKWLWTYIHEPHHRYQEAQDMTPWASIAFHPLDGIMQASPYVMALFLLPCHYVTHILLVFLTAVWATNIHDSLEGQTEPIMGSWYHMAHHTHYSCNYGQYFIFCDWFWNTLEKPSELYAAYGGHSTLSAQRKEAQEALSKNLGGSEVGDNNLDGPEVGEKTDATEVEGKKKLH